MTAMQTRPVALIRTDDPSIILAQSRSDPSRRWQVSIDPSGLGATCECPAAVSGQECGHVVAVLERIVEVARESRALATVEPGEKAPRMVAPTPLPTTRQLVSQRSAALYQQALEEFQILELCMKRAEVLQRSGLVPKQYETTEDIALVLAQGLTYSFTTSQCFEYLYPVNGKVRMEARGMLDLINRQPGCFVTGEADNNRARAVGHRPGRPDLEVVFTLADAQKAGLIKPGPWQQYPADMLWWKAVARVARRQFPDVLGGMDIVASFGDGRAEVDIAAEPSGGTVRMLPEAATPAPATPETPSADWWPTFIAEGERHHWTRAEIIAATGIENPGRQALEEWAREQGDPNPTPYIQARIESQRQPAPEEGAPAGPAQSPQPDSLAPTGGQGALLDSDDRIVGPAPTPTRMCQECTKEATRTIGKSRVPCCSEHWPNPHIRQAAIDAGEATD